MKKIFISLIRLYQKIHPYYHLLMLSSFGFSSVCRHKISCSEYTIRQIQAYGTIIGLKKGLQRVSHCYS